MKRYFKRQFQRILKRILKHNPNSIISYKDLLAVNTMLYELLCLPRWSELIGDTGTYTEQSKQALNCLIAYVWGKKIEHEGIFVDFTKFPKIALFRGFTKTQQCDVSEFNLEQIFNRGNVSRANFTVMIWEEIEKSCSSDFYKHLQVEPDCLENRIYKAATKVATLLELKEIQRRIDKKDFDEKEKQLMESLEQFSDLPYFAKIMKDPYQEIFRNFSKLRNRIRWAKHPKPIPCSVLGHMFDVACFAYLMSLEVNPDDEMLATQYFFMGAFHDLPECWTGDMPSPIKDKIEGLRKATEDFENDVMEKNVYSHLPDYIADAIRSVMLEDEENVQFKVFLKKSDNFSAFVECWRSIDSGSHHDYFEDVVKKDYPKRKNLPFNFRRLMKHLYKDC